MTYHTRTGSPFLFNASFSRVIGVNSPNGMPTALSFIAPFDTVIELQDNPYLYNDEGGIVGLIHPDGTQQCFAEGAPTGENLFAMQDRPFLCTSNGTIVGIKGQNGRELIFGDGSYSPLYVNGDDQVYFALEDDGLLMTAIGHPAAFSDLILTSSTAGQTYIVASGDSGRVALSVLQDYVNAQ